MLKSGDLPHEDHETQISAVDELVFKIYSRYLHHQALYGVEYTNEQFAEVMSLIRIALQRAKLTKDVVMEYREAHRAVLYFYNMACGRLILNGVPVI